MRALVAVGDYPEDPLRPACIQTLAEICTLSCFPLAYRVLHFWSFCVVLLDIDLVARTGGIRFLLHALGEGPMELGPILAATFLSIIDSPRTRSYLSVGTDLEVCNLTPILPNCLLTPLDCSVRDNRRLWQRS